MPLQFHYDPSSPPCKSVWMLLEVLSSTGIFSYEKKLVDFMKEEHKSPEFTKINPNQRVPAISDCGFNLDESRVILQYVASKYCSEVGLGALYPEDAQSKARIQHILYQDLENYDRILRYLNIDGVMGNQETLAEDKKADVTKAMKSYSTILGTNKYMAGTKMTIADFSCLNAIRAYLDLLDLKEENEFPDKDGLGNLRAWLLAMKDVGCYGTCMGSESPFKAAYTEKLGENARK